MHILEQIRVENSLEKMVPPTARIEFLGVTVDSQKMTLEVSEDKLEETSKELSTWLYKQMASRREVESLLGKLQFLAKCVRPGRIFVARMINWMKTLPRQHQHQHTIPWQARKDIAWWARFLHHYKGVSIIWLHNNPEPDKIVATDASKKGYRGIAQGQYFRGKFPEQWKNRNIAELEMRAVIVALTLWGATLLKGQYFWINVDNEAVATVINTGASRDEILQDALREIAMLAAQHQFQIKAKHISGVSNRIPDWLSRWGETEARRKFILFAREKSLKKCKINNSYLDFINKW